MTFLNPKFISFILLLLAAVVAVYFWIFPAWNDIQLWQAKIETAKRLLLEKEGEKSLLVDLEKHYKEYYEELYLDKLATPHKIQGKPQEDIPDLYILPREENTLELLVQLDAIVAETAGMQMKGVSFQAPTGSSQEKQGEQAPSYKTINITLSLEGTYKDFKEYLKKLEKNNRLIDVVSVSFGSGKEGPTGFSVSAKAYFQ